MKIVQAFKTDLDELMEFYDYMCGVLGKKEFMPKGNKGGFPPREMVEDAISENCMFIGIEDEKIVAAYIMNHNADKSYDDVNWNVDATRNEAVVLHALRVLPEYGGKGYSKLLLEHSIETARARGEKAMRLDCLEGNDVPIKMYQNYGFEYIDTVEITYVDIGEPRRFMLFELPL